MNNTLDSKTAYRAWDPIVRLFHWINVLCILGLIAVGLVILNAKTLGVSTEGKILLKTVHVYIGYVFAVNLSWRLLWGFIGGRFARWRAILPLGGRYVHWLGLYLKGTQSGHTPHFLGHNPMARLMVTLLFALLTTQMVTGLVLAGTDLYYPPFGGKIAEWVAQSPEQADAVKPYSKANVNPDSYKAMRDFRKPYITLHVWVFYTLLGAIFVHLAGVVYSELKEQCGLVSAMFTGNKYFDHKPVDLVTPVEGDEPNT